ncbi:MAG TPA: hypothetical protein VJ741_09885 [Solirubrobacteraceae bacterium]|nr:hypothetical protein [Solirubrobacteraceae bacterium]
MHSASLRGAPALLLVVLLCAGCGSGGGGSSKVSAGSYVKSVCSAISPLERDVVTRSSALNNSTATNATEAKQTLQGFLNAIEQDSEHAVSQIRAAGTPDISGGKTVSGAIVRTFSQLRDAMKVAVTKSHALPTTSASSFNSAAQALTTSVRTSLNGIDASGLSNPDLEKAASKEPACKSLNS